jgi:hypothetical protein
VVVVVIIYRAIGGDLGQGLAVEPNAGFDQDAQAVRGFGLLTCSIQLRRLGYPAPACISLHPCLLSFRIAPFAEMLAVLRFLAHRLKKKFIFVNHRLSGLHKPNTISKGDPRARIANPNFPAFIASSAVVEMAPNRRSQAHSNNVWGRSLCLGL